MVEKITVKALEQYYNGEILDELSSGHIYEAMCEKIVELNPDYKIENLASEYNSLQNVEAEEFVEMKLEAVLSDEVKKVITIRQYEKWIKSTIQGFKDYDVL